MKAQARARAAPPTVQRFPPSWPAALKAEGEAEGAPVPEMTASLVGAAIRGVEVASGVEMRAEEDFLGVMLGVMVEVGVTVGVTTAVVLDGGGVGGGSRRGSRGTGGAGTGDGHGHPVEVGRTQSARGGDCAGGGLARGVGGTLDVAGQGASAV
jgi:hypothetical protein